MLYEYSSVGRKELDFVCGSFRSRSVESYESRGNRV
jgi:hypothetical protein